MARIARRLRRDVAWRGLEAFPSLEVCRLTRPSRSSLQLAGAVAHQGRAGQTLVTYRVETDLRWSTALVDVEILNPTGSASIQVEFDHEVDRWWVNGHERADLRGCTDVDLEFSPSTNTLPIRRLGLAIGSSAEVRAAWVRFPNLNVEPLDQTYTLVLDYPGIWRRVGPAE